jgi:4,5-DOPA dioxygenase extradiol
LQSLRRKGVLVLGSGNMVHNLRMVAWNRLNEPEYGYDWAVEMNEKFKELISNGSYDQLIDYHLMGQAAQLAIPTPEHYLPLLYTLGVKGAREQVSFFNDKVVGGSLTMTSLLVK